MGVSQRRACRALGQPRGTQRYLRKVKTDEGPVLRAIEALVCQHPCYGYRMIHALLVADGFKVGRDRVYRLWRTHGYGVKQKPVKKAAFGRERERDHATQGRVDQRRVVLGLHPRPR